MRKIQILAVLCAVCAFSAIVVASASAASPEWLLNGAAIGTAIPVETTGELTLDVLLLGVLAVAVDCSGIFVGTVGPGAADLVTAILSLTKVEIGKELVGTGLSCEVLTSSFSECGAVGGLAEVWPDNLPWVTTLELVGTTEILDDFPTTSGYHVLCPGGKTNLCVGLAQAVMTNEPGGGVFGEFTESTNEESCTLGTGHVGSIGQGLTAPTEGGTLTVS
jgi:hypothetical protein